MEKHSGGLQIRGFRRLELLERACQAADRAAQARESIEKNGGPIAKDRFGVDQRTRPSTWSGMPSRRW